MEPIAVDVVTLGTDGAGDPDVAFVPAPVGRHPPCPDRLLTAERSRRTIASFLAGIHVPHTDRLVDPRPQALPTPEVTAFVVDSRGDRP